MAKGVLVERLRCGPAQAARQLTELAHEAGVSPLELAADIVNQVARDHLAEVAEDFVRQASGPGLPGRGGRRVRRRTAAYRRERRARRRRHPGRRGVPPGTRARPARGERRRRVDRRLRRLPDPVRSRRLQRGRGGPLAVRTARGRHRGPPGPRRAAHRTRRLPSRRWGCPPSAAPSSSTAVASRCPAGTGGRIQGSWRSAGRNRSHRTRRLSSARSRPWPNCAPTRSKACRRPSRNPAGARDRATSGNSSTSPTASTTPPSSSPPTSTPRETSPTSGSATPTAASWTPRGGPQRRGRSPAAGGLPDGRRRQRTLREDRTRLRDRRALPRPAHDADGARRPGAAVGFVADLGISRHGDSVLLNLAHRGRDRAARQRCSSTRSASDASAPSRRTSSPVRSPGTGSSSPSYGRAVTEAPVSLQDLAEHVHPDGRSSPSALPGPYCHQRATSTAFRLQRRDGVTRHIG